MLTSIKTNHCIKLALIGTGGRGACLDLAAFGNKELKSGKGMRQHLVLYHGSVIGELDELRFLAARLLAVFDEMLHDGSGFDSVPVTTLYRRAQAIA